MGYVFISYSSKNSEQADRIKGILNKNGIETWMAPESIPAGSEYVEVLYDALIECSCLVLLLTEESQASKWVKKEVNMAIGNDKTIVPLKLEEFELNKNMKLVTTDLQITVLKDISEESAEMKKVLSDIIAYTGKKTDTYIEEDDEAEISEEVTEIDLGEWLSGNPTPSFDGYSDYLENSEDALAVELQALYDDIMSEKREKDNSAKKELQESEQISEERKVIEAALNAAINGYNESKGNKDLKEAEANTNDDSIDLLDSFWTEKIVSNENIISDASKIKASVCAVTHKGCVKKINGDNYSLNGRTTADGDLQKETVYVQEMREPFHLCVCDGTFSGEVSKIAVKKIIEDSEKIYGKGKYSAGFFEQILGTLNEIEARIALMEMANKATKKFYLLGIEKTTIVSAFVFDKRIRFVTAGNSRIYHYNKKALKQMSTDSSTSLDGGCCLDFETLNVGTIEKLENGDVILLCSDGLTDMLADAEIASILSTQKDAQQATNCLLEAALEKGGKDNITIITAFIEFEEESPYEQRKAVGEANTIVSKIKKVLMKK